jgi:hypothetical protein
LSFLDDFGLFAIDLKNKKKNDEKSKTPPLIERRYKYITHTHTHTSSKQASKKERFRLQKATREEEQ